MKQSSTRSTFLRCAPQKCLLLVALLVPGQFSCARLARKPVTTSASQTETARPAVSTPIKLNSATVAELEQLPGVGKLLAERIVAHRNKYGRFRRVEHLMVVRGISERKFRELRPMIVAE